MAGFDGEWGARIERDLRRARAGDEAAWARLVESLQRYVYSIPRRMGRSDEDAADVFQATFLALYQNLDKLEDARALPRWLAVTASRETLRQIRRERPTETSDTLDQVIADEDAGAEALAEKAEEARLVQAGLAAMDPRCRTLLTLLYVEERAYQDIAAEAGIPMGAIGPTRGRCLEKLRKLLLERGF